jgi:hypothetical protein
MKEGNLKRLIVLYSYTSFWKRQNYGDLHKKDHCFSGNLGVRERKAQDTGDFLKPKQLFSMLCNGIYICQNPKNTKSKTNVNCELLLIIMYKN